MPDLWQGRTGQRCAQTVPATRGFVREPKYPNDAPERKSSNGSISTLPASATKIRKGWVCFGRTCLAVVRIGRRQSSGLKVSVVIIGVVAF